TAVSQASPPQLSRELLQSSLARTIRSPDGILLDFRDTLLSRSDWLETWSEALEGLRSHRPDNPLQAIVLAVRLDMLEEFEREGAEKLSNLGERFGALLVEAQAKSGQQLPVYLMVTDIDAHASFKTLSLVATVGEVPKPVIGWSSRYELNAPFESEWVSEATSKAADGLDVLALQILNVAEPDLGAPHEAVVDAATRVRGLPRALTTLLQPTLRAPALTDQMLFRGIYFTDAGNEASQAATFAGAVFSEKIFPETGLARPASGRLTYTARRDRRLKIAAWTLAALGCLGVSYTLWLDRDTSALQQLLAAIETELEEFRHGHNHFAEQEESAGDIFARISSIDGGVEPAPLVPTSYLSSEPRKSSKAIAVGFQRIILPAIEEGLYDRLAKVLDDLPELGGAAPLQVRDVVRTLREVDEGLTLLTGLNTMEDSSDLPRLARIALGQTVPGAYEADFQFYQGALTRLEPHRLKEGGERFSQAFEEALGPRGTKLFAQAYQRSELYVSAAIINEETRWLRDNQAPSRTELFAHIRSLEDAIGRASTALSKPLSNWLLTNENGFNDLITQAAEDVGNFRFAANAPQDEPMATLLSARNKATSDIVNWRLFGLTGWDFIVDDGLNPRFEALRVVLETVSGGQTSELGRASPTQASSSARRLNWSQAELASALEAMESLQQVLTSSPDALPGTLRPALTRLIDIRVAQMVLDASNPAQGNGGFTADETRREARSFAASAPVLAALRDQASILGLDTVSATLADTADLQAARLLSEIDDSLESRGLYETAVASFSVWDGEAGSAGQLFGMPSPVALAGLLRDWRTFVQLVAEEQAAPVVTFLATHPDGTDTSVASTVEKWQRLLAVLSGYADRAPGNSLTSLEQFILVTLNSDRAIACSDDSWSARTNNDYFGYQLQALMFELEFRCADIGTQQALGSYQDLARAFNSSLAGKYPFVGIGAGSPVASLSQTEQDPIDPVLLSQFFTAFGPEIDALVADTSGVSGDAIAAQRIAAFMIALDRVRQFLSLQDGTPRPGGPAFAVSVDFRTNPGLEQAGDQIIEWSLQIGQDRTGTFAPGKTLIWRYGDPLRLSLRWARNAPNAVGVLSRPDARLNERTVEFQYTDPWGLISMLGVNTPDEGGLASLADRRPNVIQFEVPLIENVDAAAGGRKIEGSARIFMRVTLQALDPAGTEKSGPALPLPFFPAEAP
ncbi:MAG: type VI secretion protein IcmF/TssM N-terminal domain-containing protein, partial [Pseudomonadota bacterium]